MERDAANGGLDERAPGTGEELQEPEVNRGAPPLLRPDHALLSPSGAEQGAIGSLAEQAGAVALQDVQANGQLQRERQVSEPITWKRKDWVSGCHQTHTRWRAELPGASLIVEELLPESDWLWPGVPAGWAARCDLFGDRAEVLMQLGLPSLETAQASALAMARGEQVQGDVWRLDLVQKANSTSTNAFVAPAAAGPIGETAPGEAPPLAPGE
jgi:hypothetical protein